MTSSNRSFSRVIGPLCGEFTGEFTGDRWIPLTKGKLCGLWCFFDVGRHEVLNKEWNDRRFETTWHSCDVILMTLIDVFQVWNVQFTCDWMDDIWMWRQIHSGFHQPPNVLKNRIVFFTVRGHWFRSSGTLVASRTYSVLILGLRPANERRRYFVTTSLIGWAQT